MAVWSAFDLVFLMRWINNATCIDAMITVTTKFIGPGNCQIAATMIQFFTPRPETLLRFRVKSNGNLRERGIEG